eukprot:529699-Rhodomonas_salina.3
MRERPAEMWKGSPSEPGRTIAGPYAISVPRHTLAQCRTATSEGVAAYQVVVIRDLCTVEPSQGVAA